ncbi:MAG: hypothetical protein CL521_04070 [Actinobacteria bacterium]|nr:hypothetical protein [Actinomycetota bacterium]
MQVSSFLKQVSTFNQWDDAQQLRRTFGDKILLDEAKGEIKVVHHSGLDEDPIETFIRQMNKEDLEKSPQEFLKIFNGSFKGTCRIDQVFTAFNRVKKFSTPDQKPVRWDQFEGTETIYSRGETLSRKGCIGFSFDEEKEVRLDSPQTSFRGNFADEVRGVVRMGDISAELSFLDDRPIILQLKKEESFMTRASKTYDFNGMINSGLMQDVNTVDLPKSFLVGLYQCNEEEIEGKPDGYRLNEIRKALSQIFNDSDLYSLFNLVGQCEGPEINLVIGFFERALYSLETSSEFVKAQFRDSLSDSFGHCKPGFLSNLQSQIRRLSVDGFKAELDRFRQAVIEEMGNKCFQNLEHYINRNFIGGGRDGNGFQNHVIELMKQVAQRYGIDCGLTNIDEYAVLLSKNYKIRTDLASYFKTHFHEECTVERFRARVFDLIKENIVEQMYATLPNDQVKANKALVSQSVSFFKYLETCIDKDVDGVEPKQRLYSYLEPLLASCDEEPKEVFISVFNETTDFSDETLECMFKTLFSTMTPRTIINTGWMPIPLNLSSDLFDKIKSFDQWELSKEQAAYFLFDGVSTAEKMDYFDPCLFLPEGRLYGLATDMLINQGIMEDSDDIDQLHRDLRKAVKTIGNSFATFSSYIPDENKPVYELFKTALTLKGKPLKFAEYLLSVSVHNDLILDPTESKNLLMQKVNMLAKEGLFGLLGPDKIKQIYDRFNMEGELPLLASCLRSLSGSEWKALYDKVEDQQVFLETCLQVPLNDLQLGSLTQDVVAWMWSLLSADVFESDLHCLFASAVSLNMLSDPMGCSSSDQVACLGVFWEALSQRPSLISVFQLNQKRLGDLFTLFNESFSSKVIADVRGKLDVEGMKILDFSQREGEGEGAVDKETQRKVRLKLDYPSLSLPIQHYLNAGTVKYRQGIFNQLKQILLLEDRTKIRNERVHLAALFQLLSIHKAPQSLIEESEFTLIFSRATSCLPEAFMLEKIQVIRQQSPSDSFFHSFQVPRSTTPPASSMPLHVEIEQFLNLMLKLCATQVVGCGIYAVGDWISGQRWLYKQDEIYEPVDVHEYDLILKRNEENAYSSDDDELLQAFDTKSEHLILLRQFDSNSEEAKLLGDLRQAMLDRHDRLSQDKFAENDPTEEGFHLREEGHGNELDDFRDADDELGISTDSTTPKESGYFTDEFKDGGIGAASMDEALEELDYYDVAEHWDGADHAKDMSVRRAYGDFYYDRWLASQQDQLAMNLLSKDNSATFCQDNIALIDTWEERQLSLYPYDQEKRVEIKQKAAQMREPYEKEGAFDDRQEAFLSLRDDRNHSYEFVAEDMQAVAGDVVDVLSTEVAGISLLSGLVLTYKAGQYMNQVLHSKRFYQSRKEYYRGYLSFFKLEFDQIGLKETVFVNIMRYQLSQNSEKKANLFLSRHYGVQLIDGELWPKGSSDLTGARSYDDCLSKTITLLRRSKKMGLENKALLQKLANAIQTGMPLTEELKACFKCSQQYSPWMRLHEIDDSSQVLRFKSATNLLKEEFISEIPSLKDALMFYHFEPKKIEEIQSLIKESELSDLFKMDQDGRLILLDTKTDRFNEKFKSHLENLRLNIFAERLKLRRDRGICRLSRQEKLRLKMFRNIKALGDPVHMLFNGDSFSVQKESWLANQLQQPFQKSKCCGPLAFRKDPFSDQPILVMTRSEQRRYSQKLAAPKLTERIDDLQGDLRSRIKKKGYQFLRSFYTSRFFSELIDHGRVLTPLEYHLLTQKRGDLPEKIDLTISKFSLPNGYDIAMDQNARYHVYNQKGSRIRLARLSRVDKVAIQSWKRQHALIKKPRLSLPKTPTFITSRLNHTQRQFIFKMIVSMALISSFHMLAFPLLITALGLATSAGELSLISLGVAVPRNIFQVKKEALRRSRQIQVNRFRSLTTS